MGVSKVLFKYYAGVENCRSFKSFSYIYIYRLPKKFNTYLSKAIQLML